MKRIPDAEQTLRGPAYEGRLLDRPDEEVVDQGAPFDVRTLITRRGVLGLVGVGLGTAALAACAPVSSASTTSSTSTPTATPSASSTSATTTTALPAGEIPDETAGPYPGDGSNGPDVLEQSGIVRSDLRTSIGSSTAVDGVPLTFTFTITDMANGDTPFTGVAVYAWHCDAQGRYSMYSEGVEDETWLRGVQVADANGQVTFTSIVPACYSGRWPHIHFEVYPSIDDITDASNAIATSQMAIPESMTTDVYAQSAYEGSLQNLSQVSLSNDNVFGNDSAALQLPTVSGDASNGYSTTLTVRVDTTTTPSAGAAPGGGR
ncbi:intradiol ring-cleavage dioxygenase [Microbacterium sp. RG1]|uniref:intradiol ring-cleavage dioxygenase n=1 Tax=Microbacterium sp. RG1 TaxID=2489212 RepID=UPI0010CA42D0|nr:intradiol ring-cleavage dioxygenase [Microbacterium sp. RG1]QCQ17090.1 3,4-dioxygenase subunit beta [Microbacterium sp. RG1]